MYSDIIMHPPAPVRPSADSATEGNAFEISTRATKINHRIGKIMPLPYPITKFGDGLLCSNRQVMQEKCLSLDQSQCTKKQNFLSRC